jgi:hypothetical protein
MKQSIVLDSRAIGDFQACKRKFLLDHDYRKLRKKPKELFDACLRQAIFRLSQKGGDGAVLGAEASSWFMSAAANPGLDILGGNPYEIAKDYCAMLETILRSLARMTLMQVRDLRPVQMTPSISWAFLSHADDSGTLHRWITLDSWTPADMTREAHSWATIGDMVIARAPLVLHVIEIGRQLRGRRASAWARGWKHPGLPNLKMRFRRTDGSSFQGWKPVYAADSPSVDYDEWVEKMWQEGASQSLVHHIPLESPTGTIADRATKEILGEGIAMRNLLTERDSSPWSALPMSRNACDTYFPCPFQLACYNPTVVDPQTLGMYQLRNSGDSK